MGLDIGVWIAIAAVILSLGSLFWNWRHSETLFRRQEYPPVAWHFPKTSKRDDRTVITASICNHGPKNIANIFVSALLCRGFRVEAWCKSSIIDELPIAEPLEVVLTKELEQDISEIFGGLHYENGIWHFKGKARHYKLVINLRYQPLIADTNPVNRKTYCLLKPVVDDDTICDWKLEWIPNWRGWLPRF